MMMKTMKNMICLQVTSSQSRYLLAIAMLAIVIQLACLQPAHSAPIENGQADQDDFSDDLGDLDDNLSPASSRGGSQKQQHLQDELSGLTGSSDFGASLQGDQYPMSQAGSTGLGLAASTRGELTYGRSGSSSNNNNNNGFTNNNNNNYNYNNEDSDSDSDEGDSDIESSNSDQPMQLAPASGRHHQSEASSMQDDNEASGFWPQSGNENGASSNNNDDDDSSLRAGDQLGDGGEPHGLDSNIANAKIEMTPNDMATAAGHHHHHGHGVHGWLEMGAKTGKKGAFKWHDKHPVGKGRR